MTILDEIMERKYGEVALRRRSVPVAAVRAAAEAAPPPADFVVALRRAAARAGQPALIAEVKRRSPSRGLLAADFDARRLAHAYAANGAAAISVLTDEHYFGGSLDDLRHIATDLGRGGPPLLRKDFVCDAYQIYEARAAGAAAVLLIAAALPPGVLCEYRAMAGDLGLAALVEVHAEAELSDALACGPALMGINNRDLRDFSVDLNTTLRLRAQIPPEITVVTESGIRGPADVKRMADAGVDAMLIGEGLVTAADIAAQVRVFAGPAQQTVEEPASAG